MLSFFLLTIVLRVFRFFRAPKRGSRAWRKPFEVAYRGRLARNTKRSSLNHLSSGKSDARTGVKGEDHRKRVGLSKNLLHDTRSVPKSVQLKNYPRSLSPQLPLQKLEINFVIRNWTLADQRRVTRPVRFSFFPVTAPHDHSREFRGTTTSTLRHVTIRCENYFCYLVPNDVRHNW